MSDLVGLHLPEDTQALRDLLKKASRTLEDAWPPRELLSLMALARHHGMPTRLLDWSRHPLKAALFAATSASESGEETGKLSVWGLSLEMLALAQPHKETEPHAPFTLITAPSATNSNLYAQEGVFTSPPRLKADDLPVDRTPFDELVSKWALARNTNWTGGTWFNRITLPRKEAERLRWELAFEGVTQATLFPNFTGVVRAWQEKARWYRAGGPGRGEG